LASEKAVDIEKRSMEVIEEEVGKLKKAETDVSVILSNRICDVNKCIPSIPVTASVTD